MLNSLTLVLAAAITLTFTTGVWSQQVQSGQGGATTAAGATQGSSTNATRQAGATGQANPGAPSAAQAGLPGQSGTVSDFGPAAPQQGQFSPTGQPATGPTAGVGQFTSSGQFIPGGQFNFGSQPTTGGQFSSSQLNAAGQFTTGGRLITGNQFTPGGAATSRFNQIFGANTVGPAVAGVFNSPTPWFSAPAVRQQLRLNATQYDQLYGAYVDAHTRFNQAVAQLPANMLAAQRAGRMRALQEAYAADFQSTLEATLSNSELLRRFSQLSAQYQSSAPARAPATGLMSLNPEQSRRLKHMANQWNRLADKLRKRSAVGETVTAEEIEELTKEAQKQIESTLTPEQQAHWPELVGTYYDFDALGTPSHSPSASRQAVLPGE